MDVPYLTAESLDIIDARLDSEFRPLVKNGLLVLLKSPVEYLFRNIRDRQRDEEQDNAEEIPEGLQRLVRALNVRYDAFVEKLLESGWHDGPVLVIDVSEIDFVSNVRHLIAVYEGMETLLVPEEFRS